MSGLVGCVMLWFGGDWAIAGIAILIVAVLLRALLWLLFGP